MKRYLLLTSVFLQLCIIANCPSSYTFLLQRNEPTFIIDVDDEYYLDYHFGLFHLVSHEAFDSLNEALSFNLNSRNDLNNLNNKISIAQLLKLKNALKYRIKETKSFETKDSGKFYFVLNPKFWISTENGDSYLELIQDYGLNKLSKFRLFDSYELCFGAAMLVIDTECKLNRISCENITVLLKETASFDKELLDRITSKECTGGFIKLFGYDIPFKKYDESLNSLILDKRTT
ncbi:MAG: hypothetical protein EBU52_01085 [Cytophagia bacterium]|nr:hypothetical protein [Cytophagia bacterium]